MTKPPRVPDAPIQGQSKSLTLSPGSVAPDFRLPTADGGIFALADARGRKLVLFFYPKADTPGCTQEAIKFSGLRHEFDRAGAAILGVSADPVEKLAKFKAKHSLSVALASDTTHEMLGAYGVWAKKSMYGKSFMGIIRTTLVIDEGGVVARLWSPVKLKDHARDVLAAVRAA